MNRLHTDDTRLDDFSTRLIMRWTLFHFGIYAYFTTFHYTAWANLISLIRLRRDLSILTSFCLFCSSLCSTLDDEGTTLRQQKLDRQVSLCRSFCSSYNRVRQINYNKAVLSRDWNNKIRRCQLLSSFVVSYTVAWPKEMLSGSDFKFFSKHSDMLCCVSVVYHVSGVLYKL